jgi:hypothetical protein
MAELATMVGSMPVDDVLVSAVWSIYFESLAKYLLAQLPVNHDDEIDGALTQAAGALSFNDPPFRVHSLSKVANRNQHPGMESGSDRS